MGREQGLPLAAMRCHTISEIRGGGGLRGCRYLPENGRNKEREEAAVSFPDVSEIGRNAGKRGAAVSCREVPEISETGERGCEGLPLAAASCQEMAEMREAEELPGGRASCQQSMGWEGK